MHLIRLPDGIGNVHQDAGFNVIRFVFDTNLLRNWHTHKHYVKLFLIPETADRQFAIAEYAVKLVAVKLSKSPFRKFEKKTVHNELSCLHFQYIILQIFVIEYISLKYYQRVQRTITLELLDEFRVDSRSGRNNF